MSWTGCVHCEKFHRNFMVQNFAIIAPVQPSLHQVFCIIETIQDAPKTQQSTPKTKFMVQCGRTGAFVAKNSDTTSWHEPFSLIAPVQPKLLQVLYSNETIPNAPKHYETHQNMCLGSNRLHRVCSLQKCPMRLCGPNFCIIATVRPILHWVLCCNETITNVPKHYVTHKNMSLGSYGLDRVRSLRKIPSQLHGTNFCTNCTSSAQFAPCFVR